MSVREILTLLFSSTVFFTALGGTVGFGLGKYLPAYYRSVFRNGLSDDFDPIAVGIGQGPTQGIVAGGAIGVILVIALTWYRVKTGIAKTERA